MSEDQDKFVDQVRQQLDQQIDELDDKTRLRLRQARANALAVGDRKGANWFGLNNVGRGAVAFASLSMLAVAVWLAVPTSQGPEMLAHSGESDTVQAQVFDDIELLAAVEELEFYEDVEFYYWVETQDAQS